jgi:hypothetical protein
MAAVVRWSGMFDSIGLPALLAIFFLALVVFGRRGTSSR